jgi:hypothetical protein
LEQQSREVLRDLRAQGAARAGRRRRFRSPLVKPVDFASIHALTDEIARRMAGR